MARKLESAPLDFVESAEPANCGFLHHDKCMTDDAGVLDNAVDQLERLCQSLTPQGESLTTVSAVRCLNVYLERIQALQITTSEVQDSIHAAFEIGDFVSLQPSLLAAVAFRAHKERQGVLPVWPTALSELTGWEDTDAESDFQKALVMMRDFTDRM